MNKSNTLVLDKVKKTVNRGVGMIKVSAKHKFSTIPLKKGLKLINDYYCRTVRRRREKNRRFCS